MKSYQVLFFVIINLVLLCQPYINATPAVDSPGPGNDTRPARDEEMEGKEERSPGRRSGGRKSENQGPPVMCSGFMDEHGIWNTGFQCPRWSNSDKDHCCGPHFRRVCCPRSTTTVTIDTTDIPAYDVNAVVPTHPDVAVPTENTAQTIWSLPMMVSIATGSLVGLVLILLLCCFVCSCCPGRKWVKATQRSRGHSPPTSQSLYERHTLQSVASESSSYTRLACGCSLDGSKSCGGCGGRNMMGDMPKDVDRVMRITKNPQNDILNLIDESPQPTSQLLKKTDEPPPYCTFSQTSLSRSTGSRSTSGSDYVKVKPVSSVQPLPDTRNRLSSGTESTMATFKPHLRQSREVVIPKSPIDSILGVTSPYYNALEQYNLQYPWRNRHSENSDPSRRDSGVLEEESGTGLDGDEQDEGNEAITVAHFNFRSPDILKHLSSPSMSMDKYRKSSDMLTPASPESQASEKTAPTESQWQNSKRDPSFQKLSNDLREQTVEELELEEMNRLLDSVNANNDHGIATA